jgi:hypothetical protein
MSENKVFRTDGLGGSSSLKPDYQKGSNTNKIFGSVNKPILTNNVQLDNGLGGATSLKPGSKGLGGAGGLKPKK